MLGPPAEAAQAAAAEHRGGGAKKRPQAAPKSTPRRPPAGAASAEYERARLLELNRWRTPALCVHFVTWSMTSSGKLVGTIVMELELSMAALPSKCAD